METIHIIFTNLHLPQIVCQHRANANISIYNMYAKISGVMKMSLKIYIDILKTVILFK